MRVQWFGFWFGVGPQYVVDTLEFKLDSPPETEAYGHFVGLFIA